MAIFKASPNPAAKEALLSVHITSSSTEKKTTFTRTQAHTPAVSYC